VGSAPVFPVADTTASGATTYAYGVTAWNSAGTSMMPTVLTNTPAGPTTTTTTTSTTTTLPACRRTQPTLAGFVPGAGEPRAGGGHRRLDRRVDGWGGDGWAVGRLRARGGGGQPVAQRPGGG